MRATVQTKQNVLEAALSRIDRVLDDFDNIIVAFSGGKDSGVLLNLVLMALDRRGDKRKIGLFHLDYEAQYQATTDYVDEVYTELSDRIDPLRCCVPVRCSTCTSMHETHWRPWEGCKREIWVRDLPENHIGPEAMEFISPEMTDYVFQERASLWYHERMQAQRTAVFVGIRADESLDRWRTIVSAKNINKWLAHAWTTQVYPDVCNAYPIYDWRAEDVWIANGRFGWRYNRLYDIMQMAGVPLHAMRVASPFHSAAKGSLHLYRVLDPKTWGKLISRVNGVNFTALYGGTTAMGWKDIAKPAHFTWEQYANFLLDTLPAETATGFRQKLATSIKFWRERGGVLSDVAIADLQRAGIPIEIGPETNYRTDKLPVRMDYVDDVKSAEFRLIPTWKRLCVCILKNDHVGKYMGFGLTKEENSRRQAAIEKYKGL